MRRMENIARRGAKRAVDSESEPASKKAKSEASVNKKSDKTAADLKSGIDKDGNQFWEISTTRRVTVNEFMGATLVNFREYYTCSDNGQVMPGKKGMSLSIEQYKALLTKLDAINNHLREMGVEIEDVKSDVKASPKKAKASKSDRDESAVIEAPKHKSDSEIAENEDDYKLDD